MPALILIALCSATYHKMVTMDTDLRDLRTVGPLMPEARTCLFTTGGDLPIDQVEVGKLFFIVKTKNSTHIFPTDTTCPIAPNPNPPNSNKKSSTHVLGASVKKPLASMKFDQDLVHISLAHNDRYLIVFTQDSIQYVDLSEPDLVPVEALRINETIASAGIAKEKNIFISYPNESKFVHQLNFHFENKKLHVSKPRPVDMPRVNGSNCHWTLSSSCDLISACYGSERIAILSVNKDGTVLAHAGLSAQAGEVSNSLPIPAGTITHSFALSQNNIGAIVCQRDSISVFAKGNEEEDLELIFQFRDAINKIVFSSIDLVGSFLVSVSQETFSGRHRLEIHDLNHLKLKSAGLQPVKRWDISRLVAESNDSARVFFKEKQVPSFLLTLSSGTATLWEPVVRDHWFPVMANFVVLNRNEPYQEAEEEFDFNQYEDLSVVKTTINRYKRSSSTVFNYLPEPDNQLECALDPESDLRMEEIDARNSKDEAFFPFLQPLESWNIGPRTILKSREQLQQTGVKFFSKGCMEAISRAVESG